MLLDQNLISDLEITVTEFGHCQGCRLRDQLAIFKYKNNLYILGSPLKCDISIFNISALL